MDHRVRREGLRSGPSCEPSSTLVECPFTATQACNQLRTSQEPLGEIEEETLLEGATKPEAVPAPPSEPDLSSNQGPPIELENLDLRSLLLALA